jgi:hypothetical protein
MFMGCMQQVPFLGRVEWVWFVDFPNIILRGDLNFTLSLWEVWDPILANTQKKVFFLIGYKKII